MLQNEPILNDTRKFLKDRILQLKHKPLSRILDHRLDMAF